MHLLIKPTTIHSSTAYTDHSSYHEGDSGLDLFFNEEVNIPAGGTKLLSLDIQCEAFVDKNKDQNVSYYLYPRSSIYKTPLRMANSVGIIDAGYRGTIMAAVDNRSTEDYTVTPGQRLFQLCGPTLEPITFELVNQLSETSRGEGGFGSTNQ